MIDHSYQSRDIPDLAETLAPLVELKCTLLVATVDTGIRCTQAY